METVEDGGDGGRRNHKKISEEKKGVLGKN